MRDYQYAILDLRGLMLHAYFAGMTPEPKYGTVKDKINTAEYGFVTFLNMVYDQIVSTIGSPLNMIAVAEGGKVYRKTLFSGYKAQRDKGEKDPVETAEIEKLEGYIKNFLASQGVPLCRVAGVEADDLIAYLVAKLKGQKVVYTVDQDLIALSSDTCTVMYRLNPVYDMKGIPPNCVTINKALVGDSSDNYPGVVGLGPKAWDNLVESFGYDGMVELSNLIEKKDRQTLLAIGKQTELKAYHKIIEDIDHLFLMYRLARLAPELCEGANVKIEWFKRAPVKERLHAVFEKAGCMDLAHRYEDDCYTATLVTNDNLDEVFKRINKLTADTPFVAWDYETWDTVKNPNYKLASNGREYVDMLNSKIAGCSFAVGRNANHVFYFSSGHKDTNNVEPEVILDVIKHFEDESIPMVAQNCLPGDTEVLTRVGWVPIESASVDDDILQWNPSTGGLNFVKPLGKTTTTSSSLLEWGSLFHRGAYTPEHRVYCKTDITKIWEARSAEEIAGLHGNSVWIPLSGAFGSTEGAVLPMEPYQVRLMEAIRADGSFTTRGSHCRFHFSKERKVSRLLHILDNLGLKYSDVIGKDGCHWIGVYACQILSDIKLLLGENKEYGLWLLDLSYENRRVLLSELPYWDGHIGSSGSSSFFSTNRNTVEALQIAAHLSDYRWSGSFGPNSKSHWKPIFTGRIKDRRHCKLGARNEKPKVVPWDKPVYCFTVPTGAFMVRRNGTVFITGNCNFEGTITKVNFDHTLKYWEDTKLYAHHIDENDEVGLKHLSKKYLNYDQVSYKKTLEAAGASDMSEISGVDVLSYGADDSLVTAHLYQHFTILTQLEGTQDFIQKYECPAVPLLIDAHISGVKLDVEAMDKQRVADQETCQVTMARIRELLQEHASRPNFEGVDMLYNDQKDYLSYKTKQALAEKKPDSSPAEMQEAVTSALADYKQKLKENSYYQPLVASKSYKEFINTKKVLNDVLGYLGLPPLESDSKTYISDYLHDHDVKGHEFFQLFLPAFNDNGKGFNNWKDRTGEKYEKLKAYCNSILEANGKEVFTGTELNLGSPVQNQYLFYLLLGLPIRKRTKVQKDSLRDKGGFLGSPGTDESAMYFAIANDCAENPWKRELLETLMKHKDAATRLGIYWKPYPLWINDESIMHPGFSSCGTVTRRPTGTNPNLLQVSKGSVRDVFIPRSDENVIVSIDFASEELRVLAALTQDPTLVMAYTGETDLDLHALTACGLVPLFLYKFPEVDRTPITFDASGRANYKWFKEHQDDESKLGKMLKTIRGYGKTANFGVGYGAGPETISEQLMIPLEDATLIVEGMAQTYPGIQKWKDKVSAFAKKNGYVATQYGSRRHCGNSLNTGTRGEQSRWERQLSNSAIQGVCADMLKVTLCEIASSKVLELHGAYLLAVIYDEVLLEVPKKYLFEVITGVSDAMEMGIPGLSIPMVADTSFGRSWGQQMEVGRRPSREVIEAKLKELEGANHDNP